jgi:teichoic acid transport system permease protein
MTVADYAAANGLKRMGARPSFLNYLAETWRRKDFAFALAKYSNDAANARNRLGKWWVVLLPTIQAATYGLIFGLILGASRPANFIPFLFTGVFLFAFITGSFAAGASAITSNAGLVKSLSFPRALLPISTVISQFVNLIPQIAILLVSLVFIQKQVSWSWLALIPIVALMTFFSTGLAMLAARITVHLRDLNMVIPFITRILFYVSGIFFSVDKVLAHFPALLVVAKFNPVYDFVELSRGALVVGYQMTPELWLSCSFWAFGTLILGSLFFWKAEEEYGRD